MPKPIFDEQSTRKHLSSFYNPFSCSLYFLFGIGDPNPDPTNLGLGILLFIVIMLQAAFEAFQDWSSSKVMNSIKGMMAADATVIRNGVEMKISAEKIVVGDLVVLTYGTKVPADLRLIECADLRFDRSMLTGESEAIEGI